MQKTKEQCNCAEERSFLMAIWGRHFDGCPKARTGVPVPRRAAIVVAAMVACAMGVDGWAQGYQQHILTYGRETPGKCGKTPVEPATATCSAPAGPAWVCRELIEGYGEDAKPNGSGWVVECVRPKRKR